MDLGSHVTSETQNSQLLQVGEFGSGDTELPVRGLATSTWVSEGTESPGKACKHPDGGTTGAQHPFLLVATLGL